MRSVKRQVLQGIIMIVFMLAAPAVAQEVVVTVSTDPCWEGCHSAASESYNEDRDAGVRHTTAHREASAEYDECMEDECGKQ